MWENFPIARGEENIRAISLLPRHYYFLQHLAPFIAQVSNTTAAEDDHPKTLVHQPSLSVLSFLTAIPLATPLPSCKFMQLEHQLEPPSPFVKRAHEAAPPLPSSSFLWPEFPLWPFQERLLPRRTRGH